MISLRPSHLLGWTLLAVAAAPAVRAQNASVGSPPAAGSSAATPDASDAPVRLPEYVVSADRTPEDPALVPASLTTLYPDTLASAQVSDLRTALTQVPGVTVLNTGAFGGQSSVYIRGASPYETLFVVDGVPMNDRAADYSNFLGGADLAGIDRIEVLRGPQSTLYGSALAGVITIDTASGCGSPSGTLSAEGGSFSTAAASAAVQGAEGTTDFSASLTRMTTANDRPLNKFQDWSASARLEDAPAPWALVGGTVRTQATDYEEPGAVADESPFPPDPALILSENTLVTAYGQVAADGVTSRVTGAIQRREYDFTDPSGTSPNDNDRRIVEWQNNLWTPDRTMEVVAGAEAEASEYLIGESGEGSGETSDSLKAGYLTALVRPNKTFELTGGVRDDDYRSVGNAGTGRVGAAWQVVPGTTLRANWGTGFTAPSSLDRYGFIGYGEPANPDIQPEHSRGGDAGIEQSLAGGRFVVSATAFEDRYSDLFSFDENFMTVNIDRATTRGGEFSATAKPGDGVTLRADYTYLDAWDDTTGARLLRRPRNSGSADAEWQPSSAWTVGAGAYVSSSRQDSDPFTGGDLTLPGYTTARVYASWRAVSRLVLKLRVENALNRTYEETYGYPALPRGIFGGAEWSF